jgi:hypothetical protein
MFGVTVITLTPPQSECDRLPSEKLRNCEPCPALSDTETDMLGGILTHRQSPK